MDYKNVYPQIADVASHYHYKEPPRLLIDIQEMLARAIRLVLDWLHSLRIFMPGMSDTRVVGNLMQFILWGLGLVAVAIVVFLAFSRMRHLKLQSQLAKRGALDARMIADAAGWLAEAQSLAAKSQWKDACRALYLAVLRLLAESQIMDFMPAKTNYEYWYALASHKEIQRTFRTLANLVELIWFGDYTASKKDYEECTQLFETIKGLCAQYTAENKTEALARS